MKIKAINMKKIAAVTLSAVMVLGTFALTSCGSDKSSSSGDDAMSQLSNEGTLVVGLDDTFAPMGFKDENGNLVGFDIDLANAVGEKLGVDVEFQPIGWDAKDLELSSGNIDCIWNGMSVTPEREEAYSLSNKYLNNNIILMARVDSGVDVTSADQLKDLNIGTQVDSAALEMLEGNEEYDSFKDKITTYASYDTALLDLKSGRLDVIAIDQVLGEYKNNNMDDKDKLKVCEYSLGEDAYAIGFRKDDTALRDAVNDAIKELIDDGTAEEISNEWFGTNIVIFEEV